MDKNFKRTLVAASLGCGVLAGCGGNNGNADISVNGNSSGGGGGFSAFCDTINMAGAQTTSSVDPGCINCTVDDAAAASDDSARSAALVNIGQAGAGQGASILASAPAGTVYPAGMEVGVFYTMQDSSGTTINVVGGGDNLVLRTYSGGMLVEETSQVPGTNLNVVPVTQGFSSNRDLPTSGDPTLPHSYAAFTTHQKFDAIEVLMSTRGAVAAQLNPLVYKVYGLCSNSGVSS